MRNRTARALRSRQDRRRTASRKRKARGAAAPTPEAATENRLPAGRAPNGLAHHACDLLL